MRIVLGVVGGLVALILITAIAVAVSIDAAARKGIEAGGTYALGVDTELGSADVGIFAGELTIADLRVANPEGFDTPHFLRLDDGDMAVSLGSLRSEVINVPLVSLRGMDVHLQRTAAGTNYKVILDNLKRFESGEKEPPPEGAGQGVAIEELTLENITVHVDLAPVGGDLTKLDLKIPRIALTNVGSEGAKPMDVAGVVGVVVKAVLAAVVEQAGDILPADLVGSLSSELADLTSLGEMGVGLSADAATRIGEGAQEIGEKIGDEIEKATEGVGDAVKDLFGGKKDGGE